MKNGNVMGYTRSNPKVNRLQLVSPLIFSRAPALRSLITVQLSEVMSGATYLHDLGIVHGDLKGVPSIIHNVFFILLTSRTGEHPH